MEHARILRNPGFVPNMKDLAHCFQACLLMAMRSSFYLEIPSIITLDRHLDEVPGKYSWPFAGLRYLGERGFSTVFHGQFDISRFVLKPETYLLSFYGGDEGNDQIQNSDLPSVVKAAKDFMESDVSIIDKSEPNLMSIRSMIDDGYYVIPEVNQRVLQGDWSGYVGHFIFVYGYNENGVIAHNPGPPPMQSSEISWYMLDRAWNYSKKDSRYLCAVRPPKEEWYYDYLDMT